MNKFKPIPLLIIFFAIVFSSCNSKDIIPLIFDTDANNEIDDQHALAYLLFNQNSFDIKGITVNSTTNGGNINKQYDEAMFYYIRSITLGIPANPNYEIQFEKRVASFRYEDIIKLLRGPYRDKALWYNEENQGGHINLADALELRLFSAPIIGVSNSQNLDIRQMYADKIAQDPMNAMVLQQEAEMKLMEYESNLWEN